MQVGSYQVLFELARGGMGTVFLARAVGAGGFERLVAIKRAHAGAGVDAAATERFLTEARVAAQVHHANVVSTHLADADADGYFLVCDYVEGASLAQLIERAAARGERLPPAIAVRIAVDALAGLHAVHEASDATGTPLGILHRDVSAQNLLVGRDGVTRLSDFGIAKSAGSATTADQQSVMGKLVYLAPEYLQRQPIGRALDIYALGIVLWTALSGRDPWPEVSDAQLLEHITQRGAPAFSSLQLGLDPALEQIVERACRREPAWRYQTAHDMLDALEQVGQKAGCLAPQREVAEYVERVCGDELSARRERIRTRSHELAAEVMAAPREQQPHHRRKQVLALTAVGLMLAFAAAYMLPAQRASEPRPLPHVAPAASSSTASATPAATSCVGAACNAPAPQPALTNEQHPSATSADAQAPVVNDARVESTATHSALTPPTAARKRPHRTATPPMPLRPNRVAPSLETKPAPFGHITTVNPYRKP